MDRQIKFRGINTSTGEWEYGCGILHKGGKVFIVKGFNWAAEVIPESVGQFTGLHDKAEVEIYGGDIVQTKYNDFYDFARYRVVYREDEARFWCECIALHHKETGFRDISAGGGYCEHGLDPYCTVIGNIHQNPELIGDKNE